MSHAAKARSYSMAWHGMAALLGLGRRDVADRLQQPAIVEPVDPGKRGKLDGLEAPPRSAPVDQLRLVEAVDRLGESVVVAIADAADRGLDTGLGEALGVSNADVLGGFNRSSQHQEIGGCDDGWSTSIGSMHTAEVTFARKATCLAA